MKLLIEILEGLTILICTTIGALVMGFVVICILIGIVIYYHYDHVITKDTVSAVLTIGGLLGAIVRTVAGTQNGDSCLVHVVLVQGSLTWQSTSSKTQW